MLVKINEVKEKSELCGDFLEWLQSKYFMVDKKEPQENPFVPLGYSSYINTEKLLAEYFDIDLNEAENEKQQLIQQLRDNKVIE